MHGANGLNGALALGVGHHQPVAALLLYSPTTTTAHTNVPRQHAADQTTDRWGAGGGAFFGSSAERKMDSIWPNRPNRALTSLFVIVTGALAAYTARI